MRAIKFNLTMLIVLPEVIMNLDKVAYILFIFLIIITVISLIINGVILVVLSNAKIGNNRNNKRKRPQLLMINIAFCALIMNVKNLAQVFVIYPIFRGKSPVILIIIQIMVSYLEALLLFVSSFSLTYLSCDQYFSLTRMVDNPMDRIPTKKAMIIIWITSAVLSSPFMIYNEYYAYNYGEHSFTCSYQYYDQYFNGNSTFMTVSRIIRFIIEIVLILVIVYFQSKLVSMIIFGYERLTQRSANKSTIVWRLTSIFLIYILMKATYFYDRVNKLVIHFHGQNENECNNTNVNWVFKYLFMVSCLFHSIIYFWFSKTFQKQSRDYWNSLSSIGKMFCCRAIKRSRRESHQVYSIRIPNSE